jgi:hypothetical protein
MSGTPEGNDKRAEERRRLIDLTRREKGLPERRKLGTDRRAPRTGPAPADPSAPPAGGEGTA